MENVTHSSGGISRDYASGSRFTSGSKCVICGDYNKHSDSSQKFHRFPKDPELSNKWAETLGKKWILEASPDIRNKKFYICSKHFLDSDYLNAAAKGRLVQTAIPKPDMETMDVSSVNCQTIKSSLKRSLNSSVSDESFCHQKSARLSPNINKSEDSFKTSEYDSFTGADTSTPKSSKLKRRVVTPKTKKIRVLSSKIYHLKKKISKSSRSTNYKHVLQQLKGLVSPCIYNFISCQLKSSCVSKYGRRWSVKDKNLALQLYLSSPKAYNSLSQYFNLPTKKTLLKCLSGIKMTPGFSDTVLNAIKLVVSKFKSYDKKCIVSFDEMKLQKGLSYNIKYDVIDGYENYGSYQIANPKIATHALVFMVRGLCKKWKQVFGYFYSCESASSSVLKHLLNEGLSKLIESGLEPIAVVCDQGASNQRLYSKELGVSTEKPYFYVQGRRIYSLFDAPHLLKSVRNNFKRYPVKFEHKGISKIAHWAHVVSAWEFDSKLDHRMVIFLNVKFL